MLINMIDNCSQRTPTNEKCHLPSPMRHSWSSRTNCITALKQENLHEWDNYIDSVFSKTYFRPLTCVRKHQISKLDERATDYTKGQYIEIAY